MNSNYKDLTKHIRKLEIEELKTNNYPNLRNPNKKRVLPPLEHHNFQEEQFRLNLMFRPVTPIGNNKNNLKNGRIEIVCIYQGELKENYLEGFIVNKQKPLRTITGAYIHGEVCLPLREELRDKDITQHLETGDYKTFVQKNLYKANQTIEMFKEMDKEGMLLEREEQTYNLLDKIR